MFGCFLALGEGGSGCWLESVGVVMGKSRSVGNYFVDNDELIILAKQ